MLSKIQNAWQRRSVQVATYCTVLFAGMTAAANASASATTGIDYVADLVTPIKTELTLAIVAGLALMVVIVAVKVGTRMIRSFGR